MKNTLTTIQTVAMTALLLSASGVYGQKKPAAALLTPAEVSTSVRLKLVDGSNISVDEAWETEQGIWYRRGGMSHLITRERIQRVERDSRAKTKGNPQVAKIAVADETDPSVQRDTAETNVGPVWIYLVGGARVEADGVTESAAGAWYRRGPLSVFVERSRIDHIEREDLNTLADASSRKARGWTTGNAKIDSLIKQNGAKHGVDPYLIFCVMEQESHFNARALSPKGAQGLMQLMPGTAARFGIRKPSDPAQNIAGGTRYLKQLMGQFNGRIDLVLASYNAGEGAVIRFGHKVPPYRETRDYVKRISYRYRRAKPATPAKGEVTIGDGL
ncbi:MAG TPA: lytic transglycosylase domain-containing protein [Pyrinomonadaceae bacterium]|nr:lytic transglycosylase domain-containing protein [Pyrinomonadaceae bacterium]